MDYPMHLQLNHLPEATHQLFEIAAYFIAFRYYYYLKRVKGDPIKSEWRLSVVIGCVTGAAVFSKLLGYLEHPQIFSTFHENMIYGISNKTVVGGLIGGLIGVEVTKKIIGLRRSTGDLFTYPILLGMIIGRVGCFLAGPKDGTWGSVTTGIFGINPGDGFYYYPLPLFEILYLVVLWVAIKRLSNTYPLQEGALFKVFMVAYMTWRLGSEYFKLPFSYSYGGLSAIQVACLGTLLYYQGVIFKFKKNILGTHGIT